MINKKLVSKKHIFIQFFSKNTTAKILLARYLPNRILFKISNRINLNFGVTLVEVDLMILTKVKIKLLITVEHFQTYKKFLILFASKATAPKVIKKV